MKKDRVTQLVRESLIGIMTFDKQKPSNLTEASAPPEEDVLFEQYCENDEYAQHAIAISESIEFWKREYVEYAALMETKSGEVSDLSEATIGKFAKVGAAVGGAIGGLAGSALGPAGAVGGAAYGAAVGAGQGVVAGALFARGAQRDVQAKIDSGKKKIAKWQKEDSAGSKEKIARMNEKLSKWAKELAHLKKTKSGQAGLLRSSHEKKEFEKSNKK